MKNYVFGDTGGHAPQLFAALRSLGVDIENGTIPADVRIIHCGDLIHKGFHSKVLLAVVDVLIRNNPGQWIQILGNHEFQHIEGSPYFWKCKCDLEDIGIINDWYDEGLATATFAVDSAVSLDLAVKPRLPLHPENGFFFSHAGLTRKWWDTYCKDKTLSEGSRTINELDVWMVTQPGEMLTGRRNLAAGPAWATGSNEVFNSWIDPDGKPVIDMPFIQVHGHSLSYVWTSKRWWFRPDKSFKLFRESSKVDSVHRAVVTNLLGGAIIGIDPGYSANADGVSQPYLTFIS